jgi:hypothetical protein
VTPSHTLRLGAWRYGGRACGPQSNPNPCSLVPAKRGASPNPSAGHIWVSTSSQCCRGVDRSALWLRGPRRARKRSRIPRTRRFALKGEAAFNVTSAKHAADDDHTEEWVHAYLNGSGQNAALSEGLRLQRRFWSGPHEVPIATLVRTCGPSPDLPFPVSLESWTGRIANLQAGFRSLEDFPPLIVQYESGRLLIRDGNHRHGAFEALGLGRCWAIVWYDDQGEWAQHGQRTCDRWT